MAIIANKYWQILTQRERSELAAAAANEGERLMLTSKERGGKEWKGKPDTDNNCVLAGW